MKNKINNLPSGKIGLALGSGSARGWAHIGAIEALEEAGFSFDLVAGTSIGAVVGSAYAGGKLQRLKDIALQLNLKQVLQFLDPVFPKSGIIDGKRIADFIRDNIDDANIEDLALPFRAVSTDLMTGREVQFKEGNVIDAIRASISIPGILTPVKRGDRLLADGALVNPLPIDVVKDMGADYVVAIDINYGTESIRRKNTAPPQKPEARKKSPKSKTDISNEKIDRRISEWVDNAREIGRKVAKLEFFTRAQLDKYIEMQSIPGLFEIILSSYNILEMQVTEYRLRTYPADLLIRPDLSNIRFMELHRAKEAIEIGYNTAKASLTEAGII